MIGKTNSWLLAPEKEYERHGTVNDVVFPCGALADTGTLVVDAAAGSIAATGPITAWEGMFYARDGISVAGPSAILNLTLENSTSGDIVYFSDSDVTLQSVIQGTPSGIVVISADGGEGGPYNITNAGVIRLDGGTLAVFGNSFVNDVTGEIDVRGNICQRTQGGRPYRASKSWTA